MATYDTWADATTQSPILPNGIVLTGPDGRYWLVDVGPGNALALTDLGLTPPAITGTPLTAARLIASFNEVAALANGKIAASIMEATGDLLGATGNDTPVRIPVGTDGQVLTADSAQATGIRWQTPATPAAPTTIPINTRIAAAGTAYTLAVADAGTRVHGLNTGAAVVTVPTNASVAIPITTVIVVCRRAAGTLTISSATGVTINSADNLRACRVQYSAVTLTKVNTDAWQLEGDLG
jgi:hypothetical protein